MTPDGEVGQWWRAVLALVALAVSVFLIYQIFSSGFGRPSQVITAPTLDPVPPSQTPTPTRTVSRPSQAAAAEPTRASPNIAVISDNFWLTYLPPGLDRTGGGAIEPEPGVEGGWARFGEGDRFVEAQVEHGTMAADWESYRQRTTLVNPRNTTVRGKPAMVGRHPSGGMSIVWLERIGTGAWIRVSDSLSKELLPIAASVRAPVGD